MVLLTEDRGVFPKYQRDLVRYLLSRSRVDDDVDPPLSRRSTHNVP